MQSSALPPSLACAHSPPETSSAPIDRKSGLLHGSLGQGCLLLGEDSVMMARHLNMGGIPVFEFHDPRIHKASNDGRGHRRGHSRSRTVIGRRNDLACGRGTAVAHSVGSMKDEASLALGLQLEAG